MENAVETYRRIVALSVVAALLALCAAAAGAASPDKNQAVKTIADTRPATIAFAARLLYVMLNSPVGASVRLLV